jgi:hypothetical protein
LRSSSAHSPIDLHRRRTDVALRHFGARAKPCFFDRHAKLFDRSLNFASFFGDAECCCVDVRCAGTVVEEQTKSGCA